MTKGRLSYALIVFLAVTLLAGGCGGRPEGSVSRRVILEEM